MIAAPVVPAPYQPRQFQQLGIWPAGSLQLKAYGITWRPHRPGPPPWLQDAAQHHVEQHLPADADAEGHHGLGFVTLHEGREGSWLLIDWWAHGDICCQRLVHAQEGSREFAPITRPLLGCVWESVVLGFERDAWVRTMLTERPDPTAYLALRLPEGRH